MKKLTAKKLMEINELAMIETDKKYPNNTLVVGLPWRKSTPRRRNAFALMARMLEEHFSK